MKHARPIRSDQNDGRVFIDMPDDAGNPCTACGACCAYFRVSFYCGELADGSGGIVPAELTRRISALLVCMQGTEKGRGRCIALRGELGQPGIACSIYAQRPTPCREFAPWLADGTPSPDCQRVRAFIGLPPLPPLPSLPPAGGGSDEGV
ncbi:YkgJ family cysteine cluster protein [Rhodocyclus tenuis]|uniref:YkgJ family cysteine cluster protein n=1 Tax=Rhodocyclus tenuis TaxID=1066 RepID=A0A840GAY4_RHOTE|nr:YkgJ family cysteine cluster protein [Rhodocyclus tenuis]MBB4247828.1 hypothetical protein [Rhodocyclus tenuis]